MYHQPVCVSKSHILLLQAVGRVWGAPCVFCWQQGGGCQAGQGRAVRCDHCCGAPRAARGRPVRCRPAVGAGRGPRSPLLCCVSVCVQRPGAQLSPERGRQHHAPVCEPKTARGLTGIMRLCACPVLSACFAGAPSTVHGVAGKPPSIPPAAMAMSAWPCVAWRLWQMQCVCARQVPCSEGHRVPGGQLGVPTPAPGCMLPCGRCLSHPGGGSTQQGGPCCVRCDSKNGAPGPCCRLQHSLAGGMGLLGQ
jgi:hypothetical protein